MELQSCHSLSTQKEENIQRKDSCTECSCEACRNEDSSDEYMERLEPHFTKMTDDSKSFDPMVAEERLPHETLSMFQTLTSHPAENVCMAIDDLHMRRARWKSKRQRHCSFCRIHGFHVNIKGHKSFCQFREKCMCRGCALIRCNQQVSKNQVRLRREKKLELDFTNLADYTVEQQKHRLDSIKKTPMCFKCWVHDSVRVRLKGHRNICPYAQCACPNCALNADRKWLTRELRQFDSSGKDRMSKVPAGLLSTPASMSWQRANGRKLNDGPAKFHNEEESQFHSTISSSFDQETDHTHNVLSGGPYYGRSFQLNGWASSETGCQQISERLPAVSSIACLQDYSIISKNRNSTIRADTTSSSCHSGIRIIPPYGGQDNSSSQWFPLHPCFKTSESVAAAAYNSTFCYPFHHT